MEKTGADTYKIGALQVDVAKRELVAPAKLNDVQMIEFLACTPNSIKAYECALTLETDAISFNTALLLLGLDPSRARVPTRQFDPAEPKGDPVALTLLTASRRIPVENVLRDRRTNNTVPPRTWVYTGSSFIGEGAEKRFLAELDGVLIGLMHGPQPLIENPLSDTLGGFGEIVVNPLSGIPFGAPASLVVQALRPGQPPR